MSEVPNLCPHCFYKGLSCQDCADDKLLRDFLHEAITRISYTSGLYRGISWRLANNDNERREVEQLTKTNMVFANKCEQFLIGMIAKKDRA